MRHLYLILYPIGRACLIALLDIRKHNPCCRLINTKVKTLERLREVIMTEVRQRKEYRGQGLVNKDPTNAVPTPGAAAAGAGGSAGLKKKGKQEKVGRWGVCVYMLLYHCR